MECPRNYGRDKKVLGDRTTGPQAGWYGKEKAPPDTAGLVKVVLL